MTQCTYYSTPIIPKPTGNWSFMDMQNFIKGIQEKGWKPDWPAMREFLYEEFNIVAAYAFLGYIPEYAGMYRKLEKAGFNLEFREVTRLSNGKIDGGNVDADLSGFAFDHKSLYNKAVILADEGDYTRTVVSLLRQNKLLKILSSHPFHTTSAKTKRAVGSSYILSIHAIRHLIGVPDIN